MPEVHDDFKQNLNSYFADINPNDLNTIVSFFKPEILKKNDIFLKSGKKSTKLSFIKSGLLRIFSETEKKEITNGFQLPDIL